QRLRRRRREEKGYGRARGRHSGATVPDSHRFPHFAKDRTIRSVGIAVNKARGTASRPLWVTSGHVEQREKASALPPKADIAEPAGRCPLCAMSGLHCEIRSQHLSL